MTETYSTLMGIPIDPAGKVEITFFEAEDRQMKCEFRCVDCEVLLVYRPELMAWMCGECSYGVSELSARVLSARMIEALNGLRPEGGWTKIGELGRWRRWLRRLLNR